MHWVSWKNSYFGFVCFSYFIQWHPLFPFTNTAIQRQFQTTSNSSVSASNPVILPAYASQSEPVYTDYGEYHHNIYGKPYHNGHHFIAIHHVVYRNVHKMLKTVVTASFCQIVRAMEKFRHGLVQPSNNRRQHNKYRHNCLQHRQLQRSLHTSKSFREPDHRQWPTMWIWIQPTVEVEAGPSSYTTMIHIRLATRCNN